MMSGGQYVPPLSTGMKMLGSFANSWDTTGPSVSKYLECCVYGTL